MILLKLDSNFIDARKIGKCLIGSPITEIKDPNGCYGKLIFVNEEHNEFVIDDIVFSTNEIIFLNVKDLVFCPYLALREKVSIETSEAWDDTFDYSRGIITEYTLESFHGTHKKWGEWTAVKNEIQLDLSKIERKELKGCEIIEVDE